MKLMLLRLRLDEESATLASPEISGRYSVEWFRYLFCVFRQARPVKWRNKFHEKLEELWKKQMLYSR
jgi:hypothetical protein